MYDVIVLAGGKLEKSFQNYYSVPTKAYIPILGKFMVEYVADVVEQCVDIGKKILVAPSPDMPEQLKKKFDAICLSGEGILDSLKSGLSRCESEYVLVMPCDVPLISPVSIDDFVKRSARLQSSFYYSYVRKEISENIYPDLRHTYVTLKDGTFCGGSLVLLKKADFHYGEKLFRALSDARKNPIKMVSLLDLRLIFGFLFRTITVADLEKKVSSMLGAGVSAICSDYPEMALNVDEISVLKRVEKLLEPKRIYTDQLE